jgi:hypothetical protein
MRALVAVLGVTGAFVLYYLGVIFDVNGDQWAWWSYASSMAACVTLVVALWIVLRLPGRALRPHLPHLAGMVGGLGVVAVSVAIMARHYSDPYSGPRLWPHVLACLALAGFVVALASVAIAIAPVGRAAATPDYH